MSKQEDQRIIAKSLAAITIDLNAVLRQAEDLDMLVNVNLDEDYSAGARKVTIIRTDAWVRPS